MRRKIVREKLFCQLTALVALISLPLDFAPGQSRSRPTQISVEWQGLPLQAALGRLQTVSGATVFLDRRVDPSRRVNLAVTNVRVEALIAQLAAANSLGDARFGALFYLGPPETADRLAALAALRRREVAALPETLRRTLSERRRVVWPPLTEPRRLVTQLVEKHGWNMKSGALIPHDLWNAGELPAMPLADQLTILLGGFDRTYQVIPDQRTIEIVPVRWDAIQPRAPTRSTENPRRQPAPGKQIFTLRIENQPVGKVLDELARRLGWKIAIDEATLRAAGHSLDRQVSFTVENADEDELLEALLAPAGLKATRDGDRIAVGPR